MESIIPLYSQGASIDLDLVRQHAEQRAVPAVLEQRRDGQGQFVSYKDVPPCAKPDAASVRDAVPGRELAK
jgi:hypothetical protein